MAEVDDGLVGLVEAEVKKAGPDGLSKAQLQQATGLGPEDLRAALLELGGGNAGEALRVTEAADGAYVHAEHLPPEPEEAGDGALPIPPAAEPPERLPGEAGQGPPPPAPEEAADGLLSFRISWETTVEYRSKTPETAVQDGKTIVTDAQQGILNKSPSLGISQQGLVVTQFAERRVWPPQR